MVPLNYCSRKLSDDLLPVTDKDQVHHLPVAFQRYFCVTSGVNRELIASSVIQSPGLIFAGPQRQVLLFTGSSALTLVSQILKLVLKGSIPTTYL